MAHTCTMMTWPNGNIFCVTGPLWGEFTGQRWIPRTRASSYQIKESSFSQELNYASLWNRLKEGPQWFSSVVFITNLLWHSTLQEHVFNGQSLATMLTSSWRFSGQYVWLCGLGMANSKSGYYNRLSSCHVFEFPGWPRCWFQEIEISTMYRHTPFDLNPLLDIGINDRLQICIVNSCRWIYVMVKGLRCSLVHYLVALNATMAWHPAEADMGAFVAQCQKEVHDMAGERVFSIIALNRLQARHWVRVGYNIVLYRIHLLIIVQCQGDGQLAASRLLQWGCVS